MTSILIGGSLGSGKSELLRALVVGIGMCAPAGTVSCTLIDPKRVTFTDFSSLSILIGPVLMDPEQVIKQLGAFILEMEERYREFQLTGVSNIIEYNKISHALLKRRVVVIDGYADLMLDKTAKGTLETAIQKIGQKARAAGFHLILAT
jgi:S-DNA-T family DNA segregation ATPase FtsK/SpoIIIE